MPLTQNELIAMSSGQVRNRDPDTQPTESQLTELQPAEETFVDLNGFALDFDGNILELMALGEELAAGDGLVVDNEGTGGDEAISGNESSDSE